jgi:MFS superfamily sulfate permease-like transporter
MNRLLTVFNWPTVYKMDSLKADILAGLTVALVLIPQSLAYAELAGLPPYYGLYASFLPPLVASLFGSNVLKLGLVVNFISHPVVNGFTNAAALIIASSQLPRLFGVYVDKAPHHYETIFRILKAAWHYTHWPTLFMAALAFVIMYGLKRLAPRIPNVIVAVVITVVLSWARSFPETFRVDKES